MNEKKRIGRIKIETINKDKTGIKLLKDEESFMHELTEEEIGIIEGGIQGCCITLCNPTTCTLITF